MRLCRFINPLRASELSCKLTIAFWRTALLFAIHLANGNFSNLTLTCIRDNSDNGNDRICARSLEWGGCVLSLATFETRWSKRRLNFLPSRVHAFTININYVISSNSRDARWIYMKRFGYVQFVWAIAAGR